MQILQHEAHVNARSVGKTSLLHTAAESGIQEAVKLLLKYGADVSLRTNAHNVPFPYMTAEEIAQKTGYKRIAHVCTKNQQTLMKIRHYTKLLARVVSRKFNSLLMKVQM